MTYNEIINKGLSLGISEIELYIVTSKGMNMSLTDGKLDSNNFTENFGMSIRGLYDGKMGYVYLESTDEEAVDKVVEAVRNLSIKLGIPQTLREIDVPMEMIPTLAKQAINDACTPGNPKDVIVADIIKIYEQAY